MKNLKTGEIWTPCETARKAFLAAVEAETVDITALLAARKPRDPMWNQIDVIIHDAKLLCPANS